MADLNLRLKLYVLPTFKSLTDIVRRYVVCRLRAASAPSSDSEGASATDDIMRGVFLYFPICDVRTWVEDGEYLDRGASCLLCMYA